jgi:hypothetical protein
MDDETRLVASLIKLLGVVIDSWIGKICRATNAQNSIFKHARYIDSSVKTQVVDFWQSSHVNIVNIHVTVPILLLRHCSSKPIFLRKFIY